MEETEGQHSPPPKEINSPNTVSPQFSGLNSENSPGPSSHISTPSQHPELAAYSMSSIPPPSTSMGSSKDFLCIYYGAVCVHTDIYQLCCTGTCS